MQNDCSYSLDPVQDEFLNKWLDGINVRRVYINVTFGLQGSRAFTGDFDHCNCTPPDPPLDLLDLKFSDDDQFYTPPITCNAHCRFRSSAFDYDPNTQTAHYTVFLTLHDLHYFTNTVSPLSESADMLGTLRGLLLDSEGYHPWYRHDWLDLWIKEKYNPENQLKTLENDKITGNTLFHEREQQLENLKNILTYTLTDVVIYSYLPTFAWSPSSSSAPSPVLKTKIWFKGDFWPF